MTAFKFPNMLNKRTGNFNKVSGREAIHQHMRLLLLSPKTSLFGDPFYGINLKKLQFSPNDLILQDLVIDEIYAALLLYIPEITVSRKDIKIKKDRKQLFVKITAIINEESARELYSIPLMTIEE